MFKQIPFLRKVYVHLWALVLQDSDWEAVYKYLWGIHIICQTFSFQWTKNELFELAFSLYVDSHLTLILGVREDFEKNAYNTFPPPLIRPS